MPAYAAGLGRITVQTALGEPLRAQLEVMATRDELASINARLASTEAFRLAGVEYASALSALKFSPRVKDEGGRQFIEITTDRPINEPFIDMLVELSWSSGRLVREYTFLLDPPELMAQRAPATPKASAVSEASSTPATAAPAPKISVERSPPVIAEGAPSRAKATPAKSAMPATAADASADTLREVRRGDTLGNIAMQTRPDNVSLDQMLVALFRNNPDAFDGNMNRLRAGKILNIPSADAVRSVEASAARQEVIAQFSDFESYRNRLAGKAAVAPARTEARAQSVTGKIAPKVEEKLPAPAGTDKLSVSKSEGAKSAPDIATKGRLSALEEDLVARDRALKDASGRIADLEKNLNDLKKLAELKSQAGTAAQKSAETTKAKAEPEKPITPAPAPKEVPVAKAPESVKDSEPVKVAEVPPPKVEAPVAPVPAETDSPKPAKPKKPVAPPPEPEPEPDFMVENASAVLGGAGVLAILLGYFGFSAYRRKKTASTTPEAPMTQSSLAANSVFGEPTSVHSDSSGTIADDLSVSETLSEPSSDTVDPLVEADTYLAFGKDAQAEEILLDALRADPARLAVHLKLLEIYAARRSTMQFNTLAEELRQQTGADGPEWDRTVELGLALDPNNPLYQSTIPIDEATAPVADHEATMIFTAPPVVEPAPQAEEVAALDFDLDLDSSPSQPVDSPAVALAVDEVAALDFDLDLGGGGSEESAQPDSPVLAHDVQLSEQPPAPKGLDIDFDLELPSSSPEPVAEVAEVSAEDSALGLDLDMDLELPETVLQAEPALEMPVMKVADIPETPEKPIGLPPAESAAAEGNGLDFDFDLGESEDVEPTLPDVPVADTPVLEMPVRELASDTSGLDFDLGEERTEPVVGEDVPPELTVPDAFDLELPTDSAAEVDNPEASTKLELALAYEEMGDRDGARELLEEVLTEGSSSQQAKAREKLDQLA